MPSIAQQDYLRCFAKEGRFVQEDANVLSFLAKAVENGTIFDVIFGDMQNGKPDYQMRVMSYLKSDHMLTYFSDGPTSLTLAYTATQYEGLAAIQHAIDEKYGLIRNLPSLKFDGEDNSLSVLSSPTNIYVCVDGEKIITTVVEGKIKALTLSKTGPAADVRFVNITWEDAQKLIGLPIS